MVLERATPVLDLQDGGTPLDLDAVHAAYADFVWCSLQRLGVREADLEDLFQEVFLVVHQKLPGYEGRSQMTTWLFGICLKVAAGHRRRGYHRHETPAACTLADLAADPRASPEDAAAARQAGRQVQVLLDELDLLHRAVFTMAEIEELPGDEIATILGVPVGTVYSRLHEARRQFERAVARWKARVEGGRHR